MAEKTQRSITVDAPSSQVMDVIADFDAYPSWVSAASPSALLRWGERWGELIALDLKEEVWG